MSVCPFSATPTNEDCGECNLFECDNNVNPDNPEIVQLEPEEAILFMGGQPWENPHL